jgi:hypothetical protein
VTVGLPEVYGPTSTARIADIDTALVGRPHELHLVADQQVRDLLQHTGLREIPDAGASAGGIFRANPALDNAGGAVIGRWRRPPASPPARDAAGGVTGS